MFEHCHYHYHYAKYMFCICCFAAKGFYLKYDEMKTDPNVQKWDVQVLTVSYASNCSTPLVVVSITFVTDGAIQMFGLFKFSVIPFTYRSVEIKDIWIKLPSSDSGKFLTSKFILDFGTKCWLISCRGSCDPFAICYFPSQNLSRLQYISIIFSFILVHGT